MQRTRQRGQALAVEHERILVRNRRQIGTVAANPQAAIVFAKLRVDARRVFQRGPANRAVGAVGGHLQRGLAQAEEPRVRTGEACGQRIVAVQQQQGARRAGQPRRDLVTHRSHLAMPVELVAEQARDQHQIGFDRADHARQGQLIHLQHQRVGRAVEQRRRQPLGEVGTAPIGDAAHPRLPQQVADQRHGRGLAVGAGHQDAPLVGTRAGQKLRVEPQRDAARQAGAGPPARCSAPRSSSPAGRASRRVGEGTRAGAGCNRSSRIVTLSCTSFL